MNHDQQTTQARASAVARVEAGLALLRNAERATDCGYHEPESCPALQAPRDCGCEIAKRNADDRRSGPGSFDPARHQLTVVEGPLALGACPAQVGQQTLHAAYYDWSWQDWPRLDGQQLHTWLTLVPDPTLEEALALVVTQWRERSLYGGLSALSLSKIGGLAAAFIRYARASGRHTLREADDAKLARDWIEADVRTQDGYGPAQLPTMHNRRNALRLLYAAARELRLAESDPTIDLELGKREYNQRRRLCDSDVWLCRSASVETPRETLQPAAWALAEEGAVTAELAVCSEEDLDKGGHRVWLHGAPNRVPRWITPSQWGWEQLQARLTVVRRRPDFTSSTPLLYTGSRSIRSNSSPVSAAGQHLRKTLDHAGLTKALGYDQSSVTAWAGWRLRDEGKQIDEVTNALGMRSMDAAAALIGFNWMQDADVESGTDRSASRSQP